MPGRTEREAVTEFVAPLQAALGCFTHCMITVDAHRSGEPGVLTVNRGDVVELGGPTALTLEFGMQYEVIEDPAPQHRKPWKVTTNGYFINLNDRDGERFAFHWHPGNDRIRYPHVHIRGVDALHVPTGRVLLEDVLRLAAEIGCDVRNEKWRDVLDGNRVNFGLSAKWGVPPDVR